MNKQAAIDWNTVLKLLAGGAVTGAGLGAGTSYLRYLKALNEQASADTSADDDVLYLDLPSRPQVAAGRRKRASTGTFAMGGLAGILGTIVAYNAVRDLYQRSQKKRLQKELDQAQNIYVGDLSTQSGLAKGASQFSPLTKGVGTLYLAGILAALGSGVVANRLLQKTFPPIKSPNRGKPRKIVVRSKSPEDEEVITPKEGVNPDSVEGLVRSNLVMPKEAHADGMTADLVVAAAMGRCEEIRDNISSYGLDAALDMVKGARFEDPGLLRKHLAVTWLCNDPFVSTAMEPLIAAEFYDRTPWACKLAAHVPEQYHENLMNLVGAACRDVRHNVFKKIAAFIQTPDVFAKQASTLETMLLANTLRSVLDDKPEPEPEKKPGHQSNVPISEDSPVLPDVELSDDEAKKFWGQYGKMIDNTIEKV